MEGLLTVNQAAELLAISPWTVRKYIHSKRLNIVRIGRRVLIEPAELRRIIEEGRNHGLTAHGNATGAHECTT